MTSTTSPADPGTSKNLLTLKRRDIPPDVQEKAALQMISAIAMGMNVRGQEIRAWWVHPLIWKPLNAWLTARDQELLYGAPVYEDWTVPEWPGVLLTFED